MLPDGLVYVEGRNDTLLNLGGHKVALEFIEAGVIKAADFVNGECSLSELPQLLKSMTEGNRVVKTLVRTRN